MKICRIGLGTIKAILPLLKIQKIIKEKYGIKISHNGVWKMLKRLNYSHITAKTPVLQQDEDFILIMDGAGWHKSSNLIIPKNIQIILLPPYCPELNCVERLWRFIKDNIIKNKVFETLIELENQVCEFVKNLGNEIVKSICM